MRLGEMLIRDGRLDQTQLEAALEHQRTAGGKFGSVLVELGYVDVETLTVYLGLELGIPIASGPALERCKRSAVKLLTARQALHFRCIPIVIQGQTLIAAIDDPHDLVRLDELTALTGYRILPRVAPEIRIYYYLERFYGVRRPSRFLSLGESIRGSTKEVRADLPAPPLPGLPSIRDNTAPPSAAPPVISQLSRATEGTDDDEILELDAADLVVELDADTTERAGSVDGLSDSHTDLPVVEPEASASFAPLELDEALAAARDAQSRNDVARALMSYAASTFETAALFMLRDNLAFGWKAFGPDVEPSLIDLICIPLSSPSVFQVAVESDDVFFGAPFPSTLHSYLFRGLGCLTPPVVVVAVVRIGNRPVNILYGHREELEPPDIAGLTRLCSTAADSYVRLITGHKRKRRESSPPLMFGDDSGS